MADLTAFGLEPQDPADDGKDDDEDEDELDESEIWSECVDCGYVGYEVKARFDQSVPLCPDCFARREGLQ